MSAHRVSIRPKQVADLDTRDPDQEKQAQEKQETDASPATPTYNRLDPSNPGLTIRFYKHVDSNQNGSSRMVAHDKQESHRTVIVSEASKMVRPVLISGNRYLRCHLFRLPIEVRSRIYEILLGGDDKALEVGRLPRCRITDLAILQTCHLIYHEASIALYHSLSYRRLFLRSYGAFSAHLLRRHPSGLRCCRNKSYDKWLEYPCRLEQLSWNRSYGSVTFLIGAADFKIALKRRWDFAEFITTLRMAEPLRIHALTIVATENWNLPGFNERDLVKALFGGAFEFLGEVKFRGFTPDERDRLGQLVHSLRISTLKVGRKKKKIQGEGLVP
ncbi:predicted protein [Aspergillus terreus NIH2624]|uniref:F-box domain-containing protein n=1 Tax=Aspergillus terreus (strain NIH 2624 / FGSC A1156) TaxID=341663 RepID=Q0CH23_ASPTN|nr:uncharacterized protein ATEG_07019 [Aspergillus terreus NIH2624]EAU32403.1 predicted protein [Aspergillus terreus NIH2624]